MEAFRDVAPDVLTLDDDWDSGILEILTDISWSPFPDRTAEPVVDSEMLPVVVVVAGPDGTVQHLNRAARFYTGVKSARPLRWDELLHPKDRRVALRALNRARHGKHRAPVDCRLRHSSGEYRWFSLRIAVHRDAEGNADRYVVACMDVHKWMLGEFALASRAELRNQMLDASVDCIKIIDTDGTLRHMNRSGHLALGVPLDDTEYGMEWLGLLPPEIRTSGRAALRVARKGKNARFSGKSVIPGCKPQYWDNILTPMKDADGSTIGILCVSRDITRARVAEKRLRDAGDTDDLTGLPNRRSFKRRLNRLIAAAKERGKSIGVMILDLDHFKHINDTIGHAAGDHLLRVLSRRLQTALPADSFVARLGGDEFAIVVDDARDEAAIRAVAEVALEQMEAPITFASKTINCGISIGCATYPRDGRDVSTLMKCADTALNDLKAGGRGGVNIYSTAMLANAERAASQLNMARLLVREDTVEPHYQPKVGLIDGKTLGFEALLRWRCPETGAMQSPGTVAEAFNHYELATRMAEIMHRKVLADISDWIAVGRQPLPVSINAAPVEFLRDDFAERLLGRIGEFNVPASLLEIEITEHVLTERGSDYVIRALRKLKAAGLRIALDDFGTGHSSFAHLSDYPVDCLKIDRSFVNRMPQEPAIQAIVEAIGLLGPKLALDVVAEGIETGEQLEMLKQAGVRIGQGFLFSKPVAKREAQRMLERASRAA